jgi:hypothetical protein
MTELAVVGLADGGGIVGETDGGGNVGDAVRHVKVCASLWKNSPPEYVVVHALLTTSTA